VKKNWNRAAMRIASAGYLSRQRMLAVSFENGDHFLVASETILPLSSNGHSKRSGSSGLAISADWSKMRIGETHDLLEVPVGGDLMEIPWDRIRSVADPDFRAHLADRAADRACRIGGRLRAMRLEANLTRAALAEKAGVTREMLADLELGKIEPQTALIENIALALGKCLKDFAEDSPRSSRRGHARTSH
jgi:DNA-binding XRE family transcriptional regulator